MSIHKELGDLLRKAREGKGYKGNYLAGLIGCRSQQISDLEHGKIKGLNKYKGLIMNIANILDIDESEIEGLFKVNDHLKMDDSILTEDTLYERCKEDAILLVKQLEKLPKITKDIIVEHLQKAHPNT